MAAPNTFQSPPTARVQGHLIAQWERFIDAWFSLQLAHSGGKYSIERMLAFEEYTRNTSMDRVFLICTGVPICVILLILSQESVPLQDPADGWRANYGFWVRAGLVGVGVGNAASIQIGFWLDMPALSRKQMMAYCLLMGVGYIVAGMVVAELWVFPIPFFMFTLFLVITPIIFLYLRILVGAQGFQQILSRRKQLRRLSRLGSLQGFMYVVYPAFQVLFNGASHTYYELPVLLMLPVLRLVIKVVSASAAAYKEDMVPAQVVFTVDFFDAFYLVTFIPTVSTSSLAVMMIVDFAQNATELHELHQQTRRIVGRLRQIDDTPDDINLLAAIRLLCDRTDVIQGQARRQIGVRSCVYHQLSEAGRTLLDKYELNAATDSSSSSYQPNLKFQSQTMSTTAPVASSNWVRRCFKSTILPVTPAATLPNAPRQEDIPVGAKFASRKKSVVTNSTIIHEALEVLFTSECLILSEYMEVFVPAVYGVFLLAMVNLPSAQYHTEMIGVTSENVGGIVSRIFLYVLMELISFVGLAVITQRNCRINALSQLAFVLETQMLFVQSTLMMWILLTLTYRVTHFGADFTFQFEWV